jgi:hypothetical protein
MAKLGRNDSDAREFLDLHEHQMIINELTNEVLKRCAYSARTATRFKFLSLQELGGLLKNICTGRKLCAPLPESIEVKCKYWFDGFTAS